MKNIDALNKKAGTKIVFHGSDIAGRKIEVFPTGLLNLDDVVGCGGLPKGRIISISGLQSTGKSSLCLHILGKLQKDGVKCCYVDAEYSLNLEHARNLGVDVDKLLIVEPETGEQAFEAVESILRDSEASFIVIDSASALSSRAEMEAETGKPTMGGQARLISQGLRKMIGLVSKRKAVVIFINQLRMNIMGGQYNPYIETGGMALKFYTSIALELHRDQAILEGDKLVGYSLKVRVKKNKVGPPAGETKIQLMFASGFSEEASVFNIAVEKEIITKQKTTYYFNELKLGIGKPKALLFLEKNPLVAEEITVKIQA